MADMVGAADAGDAADASTAAHAAGAACTGAAGDAGAMSDAVDAHDAADAADAADASTAAHAAGAACTGAAGDAGAMSDAVDAHDAGNIGDMGAAVAAADAADAADAVDPSTAAHAVGAACAGDAGAPVDMARFERHELIPGWEQRRLAGATVVVCGVGALGNQLAQQLALAGVGRLVLCDPDDVSESNLSRAPLFRPADVGSPKATVAARRLAELSPVTRVDARTAPLVSGVGLAELRDASLVVSCLDSLAARLQLAGRCLLVGAALLDGGTGPWGGEVRLYDPSGPCFGCGLTARDRAAQDDPWACADATPRRAGASAPVSALIGAWLAVTAVRLLCGAETAPGLVRVDAAGGTATPVRIRRDPGCPLHTRIPAAEVAATEHTVLSTPNDLTAHLDPEETVLTWAPLPGATPARESTRLTDAPPHTRLTDLGIAPREILPVLRTGRTSKVRYLELSEAGGKGTSR